MKKQIGIGRVVGGALLAGGLVLASLPASMAYAESGAGRNLNVARNNFDLFDARVDSPEGALIAASESTSPAASDVEWRYVPVRRY